MLNGFENETATLNNTELRAAHIIAYCLKKGHVGKETAITAQEMGDALAKSDEAFRDKNGKAIIVGARMRKIINFIRMSGLCPYLMATSNGYYISNDKRELEEYIQSLFDRADAIIAVAKQMKKEIQL